jgi:glycosyltransferase involved in cell wall biosynthesis
MGYGEFLSYLGALRRFVRNQLSRFDVVLEKNWLLSGYLSSLCLSRRQLAVPIENIVPNPAHFARQQLRKYLRLRVGRWLAGHHLRRVPLIIAETQYLKTAIADAWRVAPERIAVVDLGVDRDLFRPLDPAEARRRLGIAGDRLVLVYVGVLDRTHDLEPAIRALAGGGKAGVALHVVGDGGRRQEYQAMAAGAEVVFHGRVAHDRVPDFIAAGDLCLAPYDSSAFPTGELGYSTMKIPEYLSVGRPVVSVPSGRIPELVRHGASGFLFPNDLDNWHRFLADLPPRERLQAMGAAARATKLTSWEDTAAAYLSLCRHQLDAGVDGRGYGTG